MSQQPPERNDDQNILAITVLFGIVIALMFLVFANQPVATTPPEVAASQTAAAQPTAVVEAQPTAAPTTVAAAPTTAAPAPEAGGSAGAQTVGGAASYTEADVAAGQRVFGGICFACHGMGGVGVPGLGKPLVGSEFAAGLTDDELVQFITVGRPVTDPLNTTGQLMPPRGGNPMLSDQDLYHVVAYIRSLNGATVGAPPAQEPPPAGEATAAPVAEATTEPAAEAVVLPTAPEDWAAPPINSLDGSVVASPISNTGMIDIFTTTDGAALYTWYCQACHGPKGTGVDGAAALVGADANYDEFVSMITMPQPITSPNDVGFVHPFRGGVPGMNDEQITALISYLQSLGS